MNKRRRVLAVDDDRGVRDYLEAVLPKIGYEVSIAASGEAALEQLERASTDLVLLDLVLPRMSGFEVLKRVQERRPGVPVVFLSGRAHARDIVEAMYQGAADFLRKPFETEELEAALRDALAHKTTTMCPRCHGTGSV